VDCLAMMHSYIWLFVMYLMIMFDRILLNLTVRTGLIDYCKSAFMVSSINNRPCLTVPHRAARGTPGPGTGVPL